MFARGWSEDLAKLLIVPMFDKIGRKDVFWLILASPYKIPGLEPDGYIFSFSEVSAWFSKLLWERIIHSFPSSIFTLLNLYPLRSYLALKYTHFCWEWQCCYNCLPFE